MKKFRLVLALVLGTGLLWVVLSFNWSREEMSVAEQVVGVVYSILAVPFYYVVKKAME